MPAENRPGHTLEDDEELGNDDDATTQPGTPAADAEGGIPGASDRGGNICLSFGTWGGRLWQLTTLTILDFGN